MFPSLSHCPCSPSPDQEAPSEGTQTSTENKYEALKHAATSLCLSLLCVLLQGVQFYTQVKTVTSQWKAEDAALKSPAVTMPTMGR